MAQATSQSVALPLGDPDALSHSWTPNSSATFADALRRTDTAFKQQRLKAWQPILTPATVLPTFFLIGIIFVPLGGVLLWGSNKVHDYTIDYTQCEFEAPNDTFAQLPSSKWGYHLGGDAGNVQAPSWQFQHDSDGPVGQQSRCRINFDLPVELTAPVFMYYKRVPSLSLSLSPFEFLL